MGNSIVKSSVLPTEAEFLRWVNTRNLEQLRAYQEFKEEYARLQDFDRKCYLAHLLSYLPDDPATEAVARYLIYSYDIPLLVFDRNGATPLHVAARTQRTWLVRLLLAKNPRLVDIPSSVDQGQLPVHMTSDADLAALLRPSFQPTQTAAQQPEVAQHNTPQVVPVVAAAPAVLTLPSPSAHGGASAPPASSAPPQHTSAPSDDDGSDEEVVDPTHLNIATEENNILLLTSDTLSATATPKPEDEISHDTLPTIDNQHSSHPPSPSPSTSSTPSTASPASGSVPAASPPVPAPVVTHVPHMPKTRSQRRRDLIELADVICNANQNT